MNQTERGVAFQFGVHDDAQGVEIVDLVEGLVLVVHLAVDGIDRFDAPLEREVNVVLAHFAVDRRADLFDEVEVLPVLFLNMPANLFVTDGVKILQAEVLEFLLDALHTEPMRQRRVDVHGFQRGQAALGLGLCVKRAHIVQAVAELDEDDPHVLRHGKQHLAQVFDVRLFLVLNPQGDDLRQPVNQHSDVCAEFLLDLVQVGLVRAVLHRVVQERGADGIGVQFQTRHNLCHGNRVGDIRFSARAHLPAVHLVCVFVCRTDLVRVVLFSRRAQTSGRVSRQAWWSVTTVSMPRVFAYAVSSTAVIPVSTVIISRTPASASRSIAPRDRP